MNILIIGATSSIATACARRWAKQSAGFFLAARDAGKLAITADDLRAHGASAIHPHVFDINQLDTHSAMLDAAFSALGTVDIVLIAHGTLPDQQACARDVATALTEFTTNGLSTLALLTALANRMEAQRHGTLAVISSVAGDRGRPSNYLYGSAKAAVTTFCEGLRARLHASNVRVLTIKPGFVATPMTQGLALPKLLLARPETVAADITRAVARGRDTLYTPWFWRWIMLIIRHIPGIVFKRLSL